jgi:prevent-host-death family protein
MKTIPISQFRRDCIDLLEAASRAGAPLVVTRRGKPVARVLPFDGNAALALDPAGGVLKDRMEFAGDGSPPVEASWSALR